jgi:hypothetical protein
VINTPTRRGTTVSEQPQDITEQDQAADADAEQDQAPGEPAGDEQEAAVDAAVAEGEDDAPEETGTVGGE